MTKAEVWSTANLLMGPWQEIEIMRAGPRSVLRPWDDVLLSLWLSLRDSVTTAIPNFVPSHLNQRASALSLKVSKSHL